MSEEVNKPNFTEKDYKHFHHCLRGKIEFERSLFTRRAFDNQTRKLGYELELCQVAKKGQACKVNHEVIEPAQNPLLTTKLVRTYLHHERSNTPVHLWPN